MSFTEELLAAHKRRGHWKRVREAIAEKLLADPIASNMSIAAALGSHKHTVASVRLELEQQDAIPVVNKRRGIDGRVWGRKMDARKVTPFWVREAAEDAIALNVNQLVELEAVLIRLQNRIAAQTALLRELQTGRYRRDQPARPRIE